jgi:hypothetical protein
MRLNSNTNDSLQHLDSDYLAAKGPVLAEIIQLVSPILIQLFNMILTYCTAKWDCYMYIAQST